MLRAFLGIILLGVGLLVSPRMEAAAVPLQNATATFSQTNFTVSETIDGNSADTVNNGWAIDDQENQNQTAVYETVTDAGVAGGTLFTFSIEQFLFRGDHSIGRFRISITTDDRANFADGLQSSGDVTANWIVLDPITATSSLSSTMTEQPDMSILVGGANNGANTYTVTAQTALIGITGIRLEVLTDPSLPNNGPGRASPNGNFVLTEFKVDAVAAPIPEPSSVALLLAAIALGSSRLIRRRQRSA